MVKPTPNISIPVDLMNPGQFFACCGLLELADRLWPGAEGWFSEHIFQMQCDGQLNEIIIALANVELIPLDSDDATASPILIAFQHSPLRLDWWRDNRAGGRQLKVWAGSMESVGIARSMQNSMKAEAFHDANLLDQGTVVWDVDNSANKKEPFYFDARRAMNAHSRDIGFSPNKLDFTTVAFPAVEILCLIGLQRALPRSIGLPRIFEYCTWHLPLSSSVIQAAVSGLIPQVRSNTYRFENGYRTGQRKHKAFRPAVLVDKGVSHV